jgi:hypothetical protein
MNNRHKMAEHEMNQFEHDMLAALIMLEEGRNGNPVSFEDASAVAVALIKEEEILPLERLRTFEEKTVFKGSSEINSGEWYGPPPED